ncbi:MAG: hypothetical protein KDB14_08115 [Planctomycetales bacterium]|nr:hypothetical protein [Planctomycetales bacterium]
MLLLFCASAILPGVSRMFVRFSDAADRTLSANESARYGATGTRLSAVSLAIPLASIHHMLPILFAAMICGAPTETSPAPQSEPALQQLVGQWRGVGQVRRGSTQGAWQVKADWKWDHGPAGQKRSASALQYDVTSGGKYLKSAKLSKNAAGQLQLVIGEVVFETSRDAPAGSLMFETSKPLENGLARVSFRLVARGDRLVMRLERLTPGGRYSPLGEVGFTREGSSFGKGQTYVECVVTGGLGTIPVRHKGVTYYVCCTGCKEYFEEDPEEVLAAYRQRLAEAKREK